MDLQTVGHYIFPASIRDIGTGVHHLAKGNATEEQCRKLAAGILRVSIAALSAIAVTASLTLLPLPLGVITATLIIVPICIMDTETTSLLFGTVGIGMGLAECAASISMLAKGYIFTGALKLLIETCYTGICWSMTRIPRDIEFNNKGLLAEEIDQFAAKLGSQLHTKFA